LFRATLFLSFSSPCALFFFLLAFELALFAIFLRFASLLLLFNFSLLAHFFLVDFLALVSFRFDMYRKVLVGLIAALFLSRGDLLANFLTTYLSD
jgi:hypothetical protein